MWDKEKILSLHEESNHRPSDSALRCSTTEPQRLHGGEARRGLLRSWKFLLYPWALWRYEQITPPCDPNMLLSVRLCYRDLESILLHKKQGCVWQLVRRINDWILGVRGLRELTRAAGDLLGVECGRSVLLRNQSEILYWTHLISLKPSKTFSSSVF